MSPLGDTWHEQSLRHQHRLVEPIYKHDRVSELGNIASKSSKWLEGDSNEEQRAWPRCVHRVQSIKFSLLELHGPGKPLFCIDWVSCDP